jgi:ABC-type dipeptide/oligopeptide/nickel transport system permease subunit
MAWIGIFQAMALTLLVKRINILGDALRDILDCGVRRAILN